MTVLALAVMSCGPNIVIPTPTMIRISGVVRDTSGRPIEFPSFAGAAMSTDEFGRYLLQSTEAPARMDFGGSGFERLVVTDPFPELRAGAAMRALRGELSPPTWRGDAPHRLDVMLGGLFNRAGLGVRGRARLPPRGPDDLIDVAIGGASLSTLEPDLGLGSLLCTLLPAGQSGNLPASLALAFGPSSPTNDRDGPRCGGVEPEPDDLGCMRDLPPSEDRYSFWAIGSRSTADEFNQHLTTATGPGDACTGPRTLVWPGVFGMLRGASMGSSAPFGFPNASDCTICRPSSGELDVHIEISRPATTAIQLDAISLAAEDCGKSVLALIGRRESMGRVLPLAFDMVLEPPDCTADARTLLVPSGATEVVLAAFDWPRLAELREIKVSARSSTASFAYPAFLPTVSVEIQRASSTIELGPGHEELGHVELIVGQRERVVFRPVKSAALPTIISEDDSVSVVLWGREASLEQLLLSELPYRSASTKCVAEGSWCRLVD